MKIIQTEDKMEIKTNGTVSLLSGVIVFLIGTVVAVGILTRVFKTSSSDQSFYIVWPIIGIVIAVLGAISAFLACNRDIVMQKGGTTTSTLKHILFGKANTVSFDTRRIVSVWLATNYIKGRTAGSNIRNSSNSQRQSQLSLILDDNSLIQVANSSRGGATVNGFGVTNMFAKAPLSKQAEQISGFLGVPLRTSNDIPNLTTVVQDVAEAVHENVVQNSTVIEPPSAVNQTPTTPVPMAPVEQPNMPVEPTSSQENTNRQS
jgi:hypothetical protein